MRARAVVPVLGAGLLLAACGSAGQQSAPSPGSTSAPASAPAAAPAAAGVPTPSASSTAEPAPDPRLLPVIRAVVAASIPTASGKVEDRVFRGRNGQPFTVQEFLMACGRYDARAVHASLEELTSGLPADAFVVYLAPDKSSIRRAALGSRAPALLDCADDVRAATESVWPTTSGTVAPLRPSVAAVESASPGSTYPYGDSHWTARGARVWVRDLVLRYERQGLLPAGTWARARIEQGPKALFTSTLLASIGVKHSERIATEKVVRAGVTTTTASSPGLGNPTLDIRSTSATGAPLVPGRTVLVRDSFVWRALPSLQPFFSRLTVVHWAEFDRMVRTGTLPTADRYVFESVQRGWVSRAAKLSDPQVQVALRSALGR